ncbi:MAG: hypothetical protein Q7S57_00865 [bacterium]|nr:hypothetical protein [bacterium]
MTINQNLPTQPEASFTKRGFLLKIAIFDLVFLLIFFALLWGMWTKLPADGVKLHGTVDVGVDLLGTRNEIGWFGIFGLAVYSVNMLLAFILVKREKIATLYLVVATGLIIFFLIVTAFFLMRLNRII